MPSIVQATARIFEDADVSSQQRKGHKRVPSVGDVLRGRKTREKDLQPFKSEANAPLHLKQNPLGERHINSPPPQKRPMTDDGQTRPPMHRKTTSSVSLRGFMKNKDKVPDTGSISSSDGRNEAPTPKKVKSSTNLSGLLKKKSKKDLKSGQSKTPLNDENTPPQISTTVVPTPIWAQFATQPLESVDGQIRYPGQQSRSIEEEMLLYTPRDFSEFQPKEQRNFHDHIIPTVTPMPPQRPFLEHRSSRSSIFKEDLDTEGNSMVSNFISSEMSSIERAKSPVRSLAYTTPSEQSGCIRNSEPDPKKTSRILEAIGTFKLRARNELATIEVESPKQLMNPQELESAFEKVLDSLNIPLNMRDNMRKLKPEVKVGLMKSGRVGSGSSTSSSAGESGDANSRSRRSIDERSKSRHEDDTDGRRPRSRSRPRSRILTISKRGDGSPIKKESDLSTRSSSKSRPKSADLSNVNRTSKIFSSTTPAIASTPLDSATTPGDFIHYLREVRKPELIEVGKLHKLRILLRNESVTWTDAFVTKGGMNEIVDLLYRTIKVEWREEHEDLLLHETLLCLKALCTTSLALQRLVEISNQLFPALLGMLFDEERKGPSEFSTRAIITSLLFVHLSSVQNNPGAELEKRAREILCFLRDPILEEGKQPLGFISQMHISRPYRIWCREVVGVTKEVFWIFLHHLNVIPMVMVEESLQKSCFSKAHFPPPRPPHPAAPYVGGVEWEAAQYLSNHLDLMNGLIASLPTIEERNSLREDLKQSGWEKVMGGTMRTCKEKFYGGIHDGLKVWVGAAKVDGWLVEDVRAGPPREATSPKKSPSKKKADQPPQISLDVGAGALPKLDDNWI